MRRIVKKQKNAEGHCLISIPKEIAKELMNVDFFRVDFDNGKLIFSPLEV
jgi:hypothetical protein